MPRPDFVKWALGRLSAEWDTDSYRPRPVLIDQRDTARDSDGVRAEGGDLAANSIVSVGSQPTVTNTPVGTEFDLRYLDGINVRIEGVHESEAFPDEAGGVPRRDQELPPGLELLAKVERVASAGPPRRDQGRQQDRRPTEIGERRRRRLDEADHRVHSSAPHHGQ